MMSIYKEVVCCNSRRSCRRSKKVADAALGIIGHVQPEFLQFNNTLQTVSFSISVKPSRLSFASASIKLGETHSLCAECSPDLHSASPSRCHTSRQEVLQSSPNEPVCTRLPQERMQQLNRILNQPHPLYLPRRQLSRVSRNKNSSNNSNNDNPKRQHQSQRLKKRKHKHKHKPKPEPKPKP